MLQQERNDAFINCQLYASRKFRFILFDQHRLNFILSLRQSITMRQASNTECLLCTGKDLTIRKYIHLTTLLKKKINKYEGASLKRHNDSNPSAKSPIVNTLNMLILADKFIGRRLRKGWQQLKQQTLQYDSGLTDMANIRRNQKENNAANLQQNVQVFNQKNHFEQTKADKIDKILPSRIDHKEQLKKNFVLTQQNQQLQSIIKGLETKIEGCTRRQEKEMAKKRESLEGLIEQLTDKNDLIAQLKSSIKAMEAKSGKQKEIISSMLEEDKEGLNRIVFRLQNINEKLNMDIEKARQENIDLQNFNKQYVKRNQQLEKEVQILKEENFDYEQNKVNLNIFKKELQITSQKLNVKLQRITKLEAKIKKTVPPTLGEPNIFEPVLDKRQTTELTDAATLQRSSSANDLEIQHKLEAMFAYIFNIDDEQYELGSPELFDEEEKQLLNSHKLRFLHLPMTEPLKHANIQLDETSLNIFPNSILEVFGDACDPHDPSDNLKLMSLEIEGRGLVQKIGELKETHMHLRSVIHTFLKTLEPKSLKRQSEAIITVLCDFFEYSEEERHQFLQEKSKRLFGFI